ncbi:BTAD domain-containing putative transcriptional regulator [Phytohabitans flavus]|uniref:BTAD domain-containing putative transcriptional regulator n=1 Tax=Phytohabitans flavus TaxID=1076124 RepID=UPI0036454C52
MRLSVLGPVELLGPEGLPVPLGGRRQVALAALLAAEAGKVIAASRLIELLWPEQPPRGPGPALHNQVFRLRRTLSATGLRVERRDPGYLLLGDLDAVAFERLARDKSIDEAPPAQVPALLDAALGLWRGEPFLGLHDIPPLRHEAGRLVELKLSLVERAAARLIGAGDPLTAVPYLRRAVLEAPLRERTRILLIRAVAAGGDVSAAQEQFHEYRTRCAAETGLDPSPAVEAEYRRLLRGPVDASPVAEEEPEAAVPQPLAVTPVPEPVSPIVGREADVDDLAQLVGRGHRLVTLTGPGGVGKTRLAVEVATRKWGGDCAFVDLSTVTAPEDVPTAFARGLGISVASDDPVTDLGAASATALCCWWSTTSSRYFPRPPSWSPCSRGVPTSRPWSPAASGSAWRARPSTRWGRSACRTRTRRRTTSWRPRRRPCSSIGSRTVRSARRAHPSRSARSAGSSTAYHWRSSWPPHSPASGRSTRSSTACARHSPA